MRAHLGLGLSLLLSLAGLAGCGSGGSSPGGGAFESDDPGFEESWSGGFDDQDAAPGSADDSDAEREIAEADIVQVQGSRLYALSRSGGLAIIDIGTRDKLRLLGRFRTQAATPFEMYVRGDIVLAMYSGLSKGSQVIALDVRDPSAIHDIGRFELLGEISDSRIVGDVLYVVSYQNRCWECGTQPKSTITSIDVSKPSSIRRIDELGFASPQTQYGWGKRSVTVTPKRMYVAGSEWFADVGMSSTIQVVDIEDPKGKLALGASVRATGRIESRWQMDEHEGVLRVISQPNAWSAPPRVQTFEIASSNRLEALGSLDLVLPRPEELKSVRFDGTRGYAITFERTDPLFTIDLSNPAMPEQKGELEMPGWVHHMEPRGDRLYGLGFDDGNKEGSLNVSIFDVSDLSKPTMLDRVNFGGNWSHLGEDKDRIHKAFQILPEAGLILVPFSGYRYSQSQGCGAYTSGVQLIDLVGDTLKKRGVASSRGEARRAFLHEDRLIAVNDERAEVFDIDNRDEPRSKESLTLGHRVDRVISAGDFLVRIGVDWWTNAASLEVVSKADPDRFEPIGSLDLDDALVSAGEASCSYGSAYRYARARVFAHGKRVYVLVPSIHWDEHKQGTTVLVVDIEDPSAPRILKRAHYDFNVPYDSTGEDWGNPVIEAGANVVQIGHRIAALEGSYAGYGRPWNIPALHVLDFENVEHPVHGKIGLPEAKGRTALQAYGQGVMLGRWAAVPENPSRVRFYVDRIDISRPSQPLLLPSVNVPGSLLSFDTESGRLITMDYRRELLAAQTWEACGRQGGRQVRFDEATGTCTRLFRSLELLDLNGHTATRIDSLPLGGSLWVHQVARGEDRVFIVKAFDGHGSNGQELLVVGGAGTGKLKTASPRVAAALGGLARIAPIGQRLVTAGYWDSNVGVVDVRNLHQPTTTALGQMWGYAQDVAVDGDRAFFALGTDGVQAFDLPR